MQIPYIFTVQVTFGVQEIPDRDIPKEMEIYKGKTDR